MTVRVVLADDQRVVRDGLQLMLRHLPDIEVVGVAADGAEALAVIAEQRPDVALMDLRMPGTDGVEATRVLRQTHPEVGVLVLTTFADDESVFAALRAGARGYLTKDAGSEQIGQAIRAVAAGAALLDPTVQARVLGSLGRALPPQPSTPPDGLTEREVEVLTLIADGLSNGEIAERLVVSEATVKTHVNRLFAKTAVRDRAQAVAYAYRQGLAKP